LNYFAISIAQRDVFALTSINDGASQKLLVVNMFGLCSKGRLDATSQVPAFGARNLNGLT
jgi:hypothetical protein